MNKLTRYKKIITLKKRDFSLKEIGLLFSLSGERIRQIINKKPHLVSCIVCQKVLTYNRKKYCVKHIPFQYAGRDRTRNLVRIRDKFTCQECGLVRTPKMCKISSKRNLDIHHLNGMCGKKSKGYDKVSEMNGLITLCHKCHFNRHDWSGKNGYKVGKSH